MRITVRRLTRQQWAAVIVAGTLALLAAIPAARWVWRHLRPPAERPMLPYGELRVGIDASYPPFGLDVNGVLSGLDIDLANAVAADMGVPIRFVNMGYDGLYDSLKADQVDVLFSALRVDPLRFNDALYTISYFDAGQVLLRPPGSPVNTMADLNGLRLAVEFGTEGDLEARRWQRRLADLPVMPYDTAAQALDATLAGEADAALVDAISARLWLREHSGLTIAPEYVTHDPYAGAVQIDNPKLLAAVDAALSHLIGDGTVEEIISRWF